MLLGLKIIGCVLWLSVIAAFIYWTHRSSNVFKFYHELMDKVLELSHQDIINNDPRIFENSLWRFDVAETVGFNKMIFSFKKLKPESFYTDLGFLKPSQPHDEISINRIAGWMN